ncbi:MAG: Lpg1974 family pore-forming outer membrane protein [Gammaproteobacteria bacterium]
MKKQVTLGLIALGLTSGSALAGYPALDVPMPTVVPPVLVTVPEQFGSWSLGLEALYWQPTNSDLQYALPHKLDDDTNLFDTKEAKNHYGLGFRLDSTYHLPVQGKDMEVSWVHFNKDQTSESSTAYRTGSGSTNAAEIPWDRLTPNIFPVGHSTLEQFDSIHAKSQYDYDQIDLLFGQKMQVGNRVTLRPFAGARWSDIESKNTVTAIYNETTTSGMSQHWRFNTEFEGVGPRLGMDGDVDLGYGFGVSVRAGMSLLVGQQSSRYAVAQQESDGNDQDITTLDHSNSDSIHIIPETDIKMGINYTHMFDQTWSAAIEVGYEVTNYFNALDKSIFGKFDSVNSSNNFAWNGPYARIQVDIA